MAKNFDDTKRIDPEGGISQHHEIIYSSRNRIPSNSEMMRPMSRQSQNRCLQWVSQNSLTHQSTNSNNQNVVSNSQVIITINEGDTFIVQIPKPTQSAITLNDLKNRMPIKGDYRYFIKDYMDGEACFVEMITDVQILPVFEGKIIVKCKSV